MPGFPAMPSMPGMSPNAAKMMNGAFVGAMNHGAAAGMGAQRMMQSAMAEEAEMADLLRTRENRTPWHPLIMLEAIFWPTCFFVYVFWATYSGWRHYNGDLAALLGPWLCLAVSLFVVWRAYDRWRWGEKCRAQIVLAVLLVSATLDGWYLGDIVYWNHTYSYFNYVDSASYFNIDPSKDMGQAYMDAGKVYFKEGTSVDSSQGRAFDNHGLYCVAPIVHETIENQDGKGNVMLEGPLKSPTSDTFDWWAVGKDCCDATSGDFRCGQYKNPLARNGLRMLHDEDRPFYLMAIQAWSTHYNLETKHPLLFYYVQDPLLEEDTLLLEAKQAFWKYTVMNGMEFVVGAFLLHFVLWKMRIK